MIKTVMICLMVNANFIKLKKKICYDLSKEMGLVFHINFVMSPQWAIIHKEELAKFGYR
jgi:hypothetical protein